VRNRNITQQEYPKKQHQQQVPVNPFARIRDKVYQEITFYYPVHFLLFFCKGTVDSNMIFEK
jgi:hypothetical protein